MIEILSYKLLNKGSLKGSFSVKFKKWGDQIIRDCSHFSKDGRDWISYPSRSYDSEGQKKYFHYIYFEDKKVDQQIKDKILEVLKEYIAKNPLQAPDPSPSFEPDGLPF